MIQAAALLSSFNPQAGALGSTVVITGVQSQKIAPLQQVVSFRRGPQQSRLLRVRAEPLAPGKSSDKYVDYQGRSSVFPAEACEETGEGCGTEGVGKEVQPTASAPAAAVKESSGPDREYEAYSGDKTVFPGEACEELGGEFCGPEFQEGVFPDKVQASKS